MRWLFWISIDDSRSHMHAKECRDYIPFMQIYVYAISVRVRRVGTFCWSIYVIVRLCGNTINNNNKWCAAHVRRISLAHLHNCFDKNESLIIFPFNVNKRNSKFKFISFIYMYNGRRGLYTNIFIIYVCMCIKIVSEFDRYAGNYWIDPSLLSVKMCITSTPWLVYDICASKRWVSLVLISNWMKVLF